MGIPTEQSTPSDVVIRPPRKAEWPACRMLLPEAFSGGQKPECLLAFGKAPLQVLGAAAYHYWDRVAYASRVRVVRTHRRQGIGTRLLREMATGASQRGARELRGPAKPKSQPGAEPFLLARGFVRENRLFTFRAGKEGLRQLLSLRDRLIARGRLPADARFVRLSDAPWEQVAKLYAENIAYDRDLPVEVLLAAVETGKLDGSPVLMVIGRVEGILLWDMEGSLAKVHAKVVTPPYRGGWANVILMANAIDSALPQGFRHLEFDALDTNHDTLQLARRIQAVVAGEKDNYVLRLPEAVHETDDGK